MQTIEYPSSTFIAAFNAAVTTGAAFEVVIRPVRKRAAIVRTIKRLKGEPTDDRFFVSLADKLVLYDFYPCLADAWLNHRFTIHRKEEGDRLILGLQPPK